MFNYEELSYLISGSGVVNVEELKYYTKYMKYTIEDQTIMDFWAVVREYSE